MLDTSYVINCY